MIDLSFRLRQLPRFCRFVSTNLKSKFNPLSFYEAATKDKQKATSDKTDYYSNIIKDEAQKIINKMYTKEFVMGLQNSSPSQGDSIRYSVMNGISLKRDDSKRLDYKSFTLNYLKTPNELKDTPVPRLCNGLEFVAKNNCLISRDALEEVTGSKVSEFYKYLPTPEEIDYDMVGSYTPPSKDSLLMRLARAHNSKYILSTSTVTSLLVHADYFVTGFKSPLFHQLSYEYADEPLRYIISMRKPDTAYATVVNENPRIIAIDSDSGFLEESSLIFLKMGKYLESMMTQSKDDFNRKFLLKNKMHRLSTDKPAPEFYSFVNAGDMLLRSQIDSGVVDNGLFKKVEIKTRAVTPQRYDSENYKKYLDYKLNKSIGILESYEREYYDLIRSGFNKYLHQMIIGGMDSVIIAYHNTNQIFGFEHFKRWHLEKRIYGSQEYSDICFKASLLLLQKIFDYIFKAEKIKKLGETVKIGLYASSIMNCLVVMVERISNVRDYKKRLDEDMPTNDLNDIIDYYDRSKIVPDVTKYVVSIYPRLNGVNIPNGISVLFEPKDDLEYSYDIWKVGKVDMDDYMQFLHEAYKSEYRNIENEYSGTWSNR